ncbi:MAG TPA: hypothetical protein VND68_15250 [Chloroflexia bacterium]|nr:hypothetical protein [Chloroflexia bacterium]
MKPGGSKRIAVWWRFGKEHSEEEFRVNDPSVVAAHLDEKLARFRQADADAWPWWQEGGLLVEKPTPDSWLYNSDTLIYYLVERGLCVVENIHAPDWGDEWRWYVHIADVFYDGEREAWIMKDLFCDVIVHEDCRRYRVLDLHDLANALDIGLISPPQASDILRRTEEVLRSIERGEFPYPEMVRGAEICRGLGW